MTLLFGLLLYGLFFQITLWVKAMLQRAMTMLDSQTLHFVMSLDCLFFQTTVEVDSWLKFCSCLVQTSARPSACRWTNAWLSTPKKTIAWHLALVQTLLSFLLLLRHLLYLGIGIFFIVQVMVLILLAMVVKPVVKNECCSWIKQVGVPKKFDIVNIVVQGKCVFQGTKTNSLLQFCPNDTCFQMSGWYLVKGFSSLLRVKLGTKLFAEKQSFLSCNHIPLTHIVLMTRLAPRSSYESPFSKDRCEFIPRE